MADQEKKTIYQKLAVIQGEDIKIPRTGVNPFTKTTYATLDDINAAYKPLLTKNELVVYHRVERLQIGDRWIKVLATYLVDVVAAEVLVDSNTPLAIAATHIRTDFELSDTATTAQVFGSAITYGKRYNLGQLLNIVTDEDDDAEAEAAALQNNNKPQQTAKQEVAAKAAQVAETATGANIAAVKKHLASKHGVTDKEGAEKKLTELLGRDINLDTYTEAEAKQDLLTLLK